MSQALAHPDNWTEADRALFCRLVEAERARPVSDFATAWDRAPLRWVRPPILWVVDRVDWAVIAIVKATRTAETRHLFHQFDLGDACYLRVEAARRVETVAARRLDDYEHVSGSDLRREIDLADGG